jgi:hypothetical protein
VVGVGKGVKVSEGKFPETRFLISSAPTPAKLKTAPVRNITKIKRMRDR